MNSMLSKILCGFAIVFVTISAKGGSGKDSTLLLAGNTGNASNSVTRTLVKEANVIYPSTLLSHINESFDYVQKFSNKKRSYLISMYQKGKDFFPKIAAILTGYNLPQELKVLVALESGFKANAISGAGAVGYWQFMDAAAIEYGLSIGSSKNKKKDDRKNLAKSTIAAAKYLRDRCKELNNDLLLIVASYNWGIGNILKAMKKTGMNNPGFWDIKKYLPSETRSYVMNFIALNVIFANYDKFVKNQLVFNAQTVEVPVSDNISRINTSVTD